MYFNCSRYTVDEGLCVPGKNSPKMTDLNNSRLKRPITTVAKPQNPNGSRRKQCSICDYKPDSIELESQFCAPLTDFVLKVRKTELKAVKRSNDKGGRSQSFIQIRGKASFFKNHLAAQPKVFYLKKSRKCDCDVLKPNQEYRRLK